MKWTPTNITNVGRQGDTFITKQFIYYKLYSRFMMNKYELKEIDNRDSNTTELVMDNDDRLNISFEDSMDIVVSFIENQIDLENENLDEVKTMCKQVLLRIQDLMDNNGIDIS